MVRIICLTLTIYFEKTICINESSRPKEGFKQREAYEDQ